MHLAADTRIRAYEDCKAAIMCGKRGMIRSCTLVSRWGAVRRRVVRASITSWPAGTSAPSRSSAFPTSTPLNKSDKGAAVEMVRRHTFERLEQRLRNPFPEFRNLIQQPLPKHRSQPLECSERTLPHHPHGNLLFGLFLLHATLGWLLRLLIFERDDPFLGRGLENWVYGCILT